MTSQAVVIRFPEEGAFPCKSLMQTYLIDAERNKDAFKQWEFKVEGTDCWCDLIDHPNWVSMVRYRRKQPLAY